MKRPSGEDSAGSSKVSPPSPKQSKPDRCSSLMNRLYFTKISGHPRRFSTEALSLNELLERILPTASIHFNFMIDLPWLLAQYPGKCSSSPITIIVGEKSGTDHHSLRSDAKKANATNVTVGRARLPIPFGTHHTKLSMFEGEDERVHVVISTANLLENDWESKTQAFYYCSAASAKEGEESGVFGAELAQYLEAAYSTSGDWPMIEFWRDRVRTADFRDVNARIISSVPGYHTGAQKDRFGHMRLRSVLKSLKMSSKPKREYIAQCSSIGSIGAKPEAWLTTQFLTTLAGGVHTPSSSFRLVYPCVEDVRNSVEGYLAGGSLPYPKQTAQRQPYLQQFMHKWRCERWGRTRAMPHIKTYAAFDGGSSKPLWLLVTSANLSKAAWGELQKGETQLGVRSYELGVLLCDEQSLSMLPYDMPLCPFDANDSPWIWDEVYQEKDIYGATWPLL